MDNFNEEDYTSIHGLNKESSYMIVDRIIESIGVKAFEVVQNILQSKGEQKIRTIIDQRSQKQFLDRFKENLDNDLLQKYGDEQLYDDLCKVLLEKDNLIRLLQTATFCGQQGRISRTVRAILNGQPGLSAGQRVLRPTDQY